MKEDPPDKFLTPIILAAQIDMVERVSNAISTLFLRE